MSIIILYVITKIITFNKAAQSYKLFFLLLYVYIYTVINIISKYNTVTIPSEGFLLLSTLYR